MVDTSTQHGRPAAPASDINLSSTQRSSSRTISPADGNDRRASLPSNRQNDPERMQHLSTQVSRRSSKRQPRWWKIRWFKGMVDDVKRRAPFYWSDWTDAWDYRVVPATTYMYFAKYVQDLPMPMHSHPSTSILLFWTDRTCLLQVEMMGFPRTECDGHLRATLRAYSTP